ncbi:hypothetical protein B296_00051303 [Ensete ventricosum]|uniref:Uncharacterized protein n=1 Tax=Ensete ventricosum TaxID=4639 RepID=A0A426XT27_ENSVE|nr:hypothetical protein B296_00051303 [Ensete ventricosum]
MRVDFPRWEGDPIGWISSVECYFRFHRTTDASMVEIAAIPLKEMLFNGLIGSSIPMEAFPSGIKKVARNTPRDRLRKIVRLAAGNAGGCQITGVRSLSLVVMYDCNP